MRILQISSAQGFGGGERHLSDLVNALAFRGHTVDLAVRPGSAVINELKNVPSERISLLGLRNSFDVSTARALSDLVKTREIEIIHSHLARDYPAACFAASQNPRAQLVLTRHVLFPLSGLHRISIAQVTRIIAVSKAVALNLQKHKWIPREKIRIIPNGIDVGRFAAPLDHTDREPLLSSRRIPQDALLIGTVAELNPLKGNEEFLRAAQLVAQRFPQSHFLIAGSAAPRRKRYRAEIEHLLTILNLEGRVHLLGWLEEVAPLLRSLDLFVSASRSESFGLSIAEAMASGNAVVATGTDGAREVIQEGITGMLTPVGDFRSLAAAMIELLIDNERRKAMGRNAQEMVRTRFNLETMVSSTEELYRECLSDN